MKAAEPKNIPSCYIPGYAQARALNPEMAGNYIAHTQIGDPDADAVIEQVASLGRGTSARLFKLGLNTEDPKEREQVLRDAPSALRDFLRKLDTPPDWVDLSAYNPGIHMFHRNSSLVLGAFVGGVLVEGFSTNISKSFFITGRVREHGVRRLRQNNRHMYRDIHAWRAGTNRRRLEVVCPYPAGPRTDQIPAEKLGRMGY